MAEPLIVQRRFYLSFIAYWLIWIVIETNMLQWYGLPAKSSLADSAITIVLLAVICILVCNILTYYQPSRDLMLYLCALAGISTLVWGIADRALLQSLIYTSPSRARFLDRSMPVRSCIAFLHIACMILITLVWKKTGEERDAVERKNDLEKISREAELYKLRQQLHPHFLFNSLNSINALIHTRPEQARRMVQQLSEFLRGTLKREESQKISLSEELDYLKLYLDIEKVRFGHRLKAEFDTTEDALAATVPALVLQPLLENAIKFGLYGTTGEVIIGLHARILEHYLVVAVTNPYEPDMQMPEGTGFGLKSIRRRLYLLFGRDDLMEVSQEAQFFSVIFRIPQT